MENPGLKRHTPTEPILKVTYRRTALYPATTPPRTTGQGAYGVPPEPATLKENVQNAPPTMGSVTPGPNATNGAPPILRLNDISATPNMPDPNRGAEERKREVQKQVGGGSKENPAYDRAQQAVQNRVQQRRAHPLHRGSINDQFRQRGSDNCETCWLKNGEHIERADHNDMYDPYDYQNPHEFKPFESHPGQRYSVFDENPAAIRGEIVQSGGSEADNLAHFVDPLYRPEKNLMSGNHGDQPMIDFKHQYRPEDEEQMLDFGYGLPSGQTCETCYMKHGDEESPVGAEHAYTRNHPYKPMVMEPGQRFSAFDYGRGEWLYDVDNPHYFERDPAPSIIEGGTHQPMVDLKLTRGEHGLDQPHHHPSFPACRGCEEDYGLVSQHPDSPIHNLDNYRNVVAHPYEPVEDLPAGVRLAAQVPSDDPVFPYNPTENPEQDTTDLENLQSGDDTFRPHNPALDRIMNEIQGLPDMTRNDPKLMEGVNRILDQGPEEGSDALAGGLNTIFDSMRETQGMSPEQRLQHGKDAIDAHVETGKLSHKEYVKRLHDDWEARGGHATGEPRPVEKFSPRYTKPQQIVEDPNDPFPQNTSPIHFVGKCEGCGKKLYDSAGSSGDPRGELGDNTVGTIDAREYDATDVPKEERTGERRMHGPSALICPNCDNDSDRYNRILDRYKGHKAGERDGGGYWGHPPGSDMNDWSARKFIPTTYSKDRKGKWHNPGEKPGSCPECDAGLTGFDRPGPPKQAEAAWSGFLRGEPVILSERVDLIRTAETDEEFWARQPDVVTLHGGTADAAHGYAPDDNNYRDPGVDLDDDDLDLPDRMSLRDHAHLIRSGFRWNEGMRYPEYTHLYHREIRDSDGRPAYADEAHVIEHNTSHQGPVLPTEDDPEPHHSRYPFAHRYHPAGMGDEGFVAGYNTADQATKAARQLALYGPRHPRSVEIMNRYHDLGTDEPYNESQTFPHEFQREAAA